MSRKLALIIGNSEYEDETLARLVNPDTDVKALAEVLSDPEIGGFDEVIALINEPSTTIRRAISRFFMKRVRDDLLLLYFSGHGIRDDRGQLFLGVKDTEHDLLRVTAIPAAFITEEMDNSRSRRQVLILDCCHSGAFSRGMKAAPGASVGTAAAFEGAGSGRVVLTATDSTQYAWEGDRVIGQAENSVFTHYLIKGLRTGEADTAGDGRITLDELYDYVYEQVVHETPLQTPSKWSYGQQGELVIARNPHPEVKPVELPSELQQTIDDPRSWVREGAVRELDRVLRGSHPGLALSALAALKRLVDDDSRRVSTMATESLAAFDEVQRVEEETKAAEMAQATAERQAAKKAKKERLASEKEQAERKAKEEAERDAREKAAQERLAFERGDRERLEREKAEAGRKAAETTAAKAEQPVVAINAAVVPGAMKWPPKLETTLSVPWKQVFMITIGWAIALAIVGSRGLAFGWAIVGYIAGALGWLTTGLVLRRRGLSIYWMQVAVGWTIGWTIGLLLLGSGFNSFSIITGVIVGTIGSSIMVRQLGQMRHQSVKAGQERLALERFDRDGPAGEKAEAGWKAAEGTGAKSEPQLATIMRTVVPDDMRWPLWLTTIGWAIGWAIGWVVSEAYGWGGTEYGTIWTIIPVLGGLITGLALRQAEPSIHWKQILMITTGWTIGSIFGGAISMSLYGTYEVAINGSIRGAVGGLITGLALRWAEPSIQWKQILLITIGWTIGWTIGEYYGHDIYDAFYEVIEGTTVWWAFPGAIMGGISVVIGSSVMFWQLGQSRHQSVKAGQE